MCLRCAQIPILTVNAVADRIVIRIQGLIKMDVIAGSLSRLPCMADQLALVKACL